MTVEVYVHPDGDDSATGMPEAPLRTVVAGVSAVAAGGIVNLQGGMFYGDVEIVDINPTSFPVVIRSAPGEHAVLESSRPEFRGSTPNHAWRVVGTEGEYVSVKPIPEANPTENRVRGAFVDRHPYTRLISYARVEDLRATGETFPKLVEGDPGFEDANPTTKPFRRPWVYMGPGIWLDAEARVHIRLSHTHNHIASWPDYHGETDPRRLRLAISARLATVLTLRRCSNIEIRDLELRYGGERTVAIRACSNILFDHVNVKAASQAVRLDKDGDSFEGCDTITLRDCRLDGGIPTWYFRSDRKDNYVILHENGTKEDNDLGSATSSVCFSGNDKVPLANVTVEQCEFVNVHDVPVFGANPHYHHNWLDNVNDDALLFIEGLSNARVHHNVLTRVLTALSFADSGASGQVSVYRNLIDLRTPTLGVRPGLNGPVGSLRYGQLYKSNETEGPIDIFQNTCVIRDAGMTDEVGSQGNVAAFTHYRAMKGAQRRAYNNIFFAFYSAPGQAKPIAFLPPHTFPGPSDGNVYQRVGTGAAKFKIPKPDGSGLVDAPDLTVYQVQEAPYEQRGQSADPLLRSMGSDGVPQVHDDLRLRAESPARNAGAFLVGTMRINDGIPINQVDTAFSRPDIGCYRGNDAFLAVGVNQRHPFPRPPFMIVAPHRQKRRAD